MVYYQTTAEGGGETPRPAFTSFRVLTYLACIVVLLGAFAWTADQLRMGLAEVFLRGASTSNLEFFLLFELHIFVVAILAYLVVKNAVRLVLDRRQNILGSKLRLRLVVAFIALSMVPTTLLFILSQGLLSAVIQDWFSPQVEASVSGAKNLAQRYYHHSQRRIGMEAGNIVESLLAVSKIGPIVDGEVNSIREGGLDERKLSVSGAVKAVLSAKRQQYDLVDLRLLDKERRVVFADSELNVTGRNTPVPNNTRVEEALHGRKVIGPEQSMWGEFIRAYVPVDIDPIWGVDFDRFPFVGDKSIPYFHERYVLVATRAQPADFTETLGEVLDSYDDYHELKTFRRPLASSYILALVVVTLLIVFAAMWIGFYLASSITGPIKLLAEGTVQIAKGNLHHRIPHIGDDELSLLVNLFNRMTDDLRSATNEIVSRRRYMEIILANVGVGVISLDERGKIRTINQAAAAILGVVNPEDVLDRQIEDTVSGEFIESLESSLDELRASGAAVSSFTTTLAKKHVQVTISQLVGDASNVLGAVLLLDDLTELVNAQRVAAWREVARRIAHEIKNPLTPIQLSAQRILRRLRVDDGSQDHGMAFSELDTNGDASRMTGLRAVISECAETIVAQVKSLKSLVDEFSRFARMPKIQPVPVNLNDVVRESSAMYREAHENICFELELDDTIPILMLDRDQMGRVIVNLLDNAVYSVLQRITQERNGNPVKADVTGKIVIRTFKSDDLGLVSMEVIDFGMGLETNTIGHLFEPYFSTKRGGTGLGLAIVNAIAADHQGFVRVRDNIPCGAVFTVELPIIMQKVGITQRRLASKKETRLS